MMRIFFVLCLLILAGVRPKAHAQDLSRYQLTPATRKFFENNATNPDRFTPTCLSLEACEDFNHHEKTFRFEGGNAKLAFDRLLGLKGTDLWRGRGTFDFVYDANSKTYFDRTDPKVLPAFAAGQVYFVELAIGGILRIVSAYVVTAIDPVKMKISLSYVKPNKSAGIQTITFKDTQEGFEVLHETRFKSDSWIRDTLFYRSYHVQFADEFYRNFSEILAKGKPSSVLNEF